MNEFHTYAKRKTENGGWKTFASTGDTIYEAAIRTFKETVQFYLKEKMPECVRVVCMQGNTVIASYSIN
jgi:hypothetical protein